MSQGPTDSDVRRVAAQAGWIVDLEYKDGTETKRALYAVVEWEFEAREQHMKVLCWGPLGPALEETAFLQEIDIRAAGSRARVRFAPDQMSGRSGV